MYKNITKSRHLKCNMTSCCETKPFFCPVFTNLYKDDTTIHPVMQCGWDGGGGGGVVERSSPFLSVLHLLADLVAQDLVPVDLGARHRKLAA